MKTLGGALSKIRRLAAVFLCFSMIAALLVPFAALAEETEQETESGDKVIRVGWYESPFNTMDQFGRRTGYAYEYQRKLTAYTGWSYEYVEGSWSELMEMLSAGEIDLMSDVSYLEERTDHMLYATLPMGTEAYYIFVRPEDADETAEDYTKLDGKKVGVTKGSIQKGMFLEWAKQRGIEVKLIELTCSEDDSLRMMHNKKIDAFITMDFFGNPEIASPICKIGSSDFYFAVNRDRPDLLVELDAALNRIQDEDMYYNQELHEKYFRSTGADYYLTDKESSWLTDHGTIRVGYQDDYLAFCAKDEDTGELIGALRDYLDYASTCLENASLDFETIAYPTVGAAMEALAEGEIDCVFPANLNDYDSEMMDVVMSPALMRTEMDAVVRASDQKEFIRKDGVKVAVNEGNTNYERFLAEHYPGWKPVYFPDTPAGLDGVAKGEADCVIISNYRFSNISKQCERLHLTTIYTDVDMDYCFAIRRGDTDLYSILARVIKVVPDATIHAALTYYSTEDVKTSFADLIKDNLFIVMTVIAVVLVIILILLLRSIRAEKKAREEEHLVNDLNKKVFVDALTSVRNKGGFSNYIQQMQDGLDRGEASVFAVGVFDCDDLKKINDQYGHDKGDEYLKAASRLICHVFQHSPVFRIGGDAFSVILQNEDFRNREALSKEFEARCQEINSSVQNPWEQVNVSLGIAVYDPENDSAVIDVVRRADKVMYEEKHIHKKAKRQNR